MIRNRMDTACSMLRPCVGSNISTSPWEQERISECYFNTDIESKLLLYYHLKGQKNSNYMESIIQ